MSCKIFDISNLVEVLFVGHVRKKYETGETDNVGLSNKNKVLKAAILSVLKIMNLRYPFKSSEDKSRLFAAMFPDSRDASRATCGERKWVYVSTFGFSPYFKRLVLAEYSH